MSSETTKNHNISVQEHEGIEDEHLMRLEIALSNLASVLEQEKFRQDEEKRLLEQKYKDKLSHITKRVIELEANITALIEKTMEKKREG